MYYNLIKIDLKAIRIELKHGIKLELIGNYDSIMGYNTPPLAHSKHVVNKLCTWHRGM